MTTTAVDPVCGMQVNPEIAATQELTSEHEGRTYFFCGKGCKLDFDDDPARYFDPDYQPQM
jgi:P-type Cu+ transporter